MPLFRSTRNAPPRLGCFGKVPGYGDYLSLHSDTPEAHALIAWMQNGTARGTGAPAEDTDQSLRFVWRPRDARRTLVGVMWPSADTAGRRFPFALFTTAPRDSLDAAGPRRLLAAEPYWVAFEALRARMLGVERLEDLRRLVRDVSLPDLLDVPSVNSAYVGRVAPTGADSWSAVPLGLHLNDVVHLAESLRGTDGVPAFALRMRLHSQVDPTAEAVTWLHVLVENLGVEDVDAALFLRSSTADGASLLVFHRDLEPADLSYVLAPRDGSRTIDEIGFRDAPAGTHDTAFLETFEHKWSAGARSLASLLEIGAQGWRPGELPADGPLAVVRPESDAAAADTQPAEAEAPRDDEDITGEIEPPATDPITGPVDETAADEETVAGSSLPDELLALREETTAAPATDVAAMERRVRELVSRPLLPGRLVRVRLPGGDGAPSGEVLVYMDDQGAAASHPGATAALDQVRRRIAGHEEARGLVERIRAAHRDLEAELDRLVDAACARTRRPGAAAGRARRDTVTAEGR